MSFLHDKSDEIENRRFETEAAHSFELRTGSLKKDKNRYDNTKESQTGAWEELGQKGPSLPATALLGVAVGICIIGITLVVGLSLTSNKTESTAVGKSTEEKAAATKDLEAARSGLREAVAGYLGSTSVAEKLVFVRNRSTVEALMVPYYQQHPDKLQKAELIDLKVLRRFYRANRLDENRTIYITAGTRTDGIVEPFIVEELDGRFAVDWETHVRYNPMSRDQLLKRRPSTPKAFRVYLSRSDRYFEPFDSHNHLAVQLIFPDKIDSVDAFVERTNPSAQLIQELLANNHLPPVILDLKIPPNFGGLAVVIDSLVQPRWFVIE